MHWSHSIDTLVILDQCTGHTRSVLTAPAGIPFTGAMRMLPTGEVIPVPPAERHQMAKEQASRKTAARRRMTMSYGDTTSKQQVVSPATAMGSTEKCTFLFVFVSLQSRLYFSILQDALSISPDLSFHHVHNVASSRSKSTSDFASCVHRFNHIIVATQYMRPFKRLHKSLT
jgi:hypothetical protein